LIVCLVWAKDQATDSRILLVENGVEIFRKEEAVIMTIKKEITEEHAST